MLLIEWGYMPTEVRDAFRPMLLRYLWLVPSWCRTLRVQYRQQFREGDSTALASCHAMPEYRLATISVHSPWLDDRPSERAASVLHEILHIPTMPLVTEAQEQINRLACDNDKLREHVHEQLRQRMEGTTQDLMYAILMLPHDALPTVPFREEEDEQPDALDIRERHRRAA